MFSRHGRAALAALTLMFATACASNAAAARVPRAASDQWALTAIGSKDVWKRAQGKAVTVAILDSGADLRHPDLAPNLWINSRETPGNDIDDDGDGYVDDVHGYDFVDDDGDPSDANGHGTHVAGIVAGACRSVCGVAPKANLMIVRVLDEHARGSADRVALGIRYAVDRGAKIINLSLTTTAPDPSLQAAIDYAATRGVLVVAAAGNDSSNVDLIPSYPAALNSPNLISVASTDSDGSLSAMSNFGRHAVTIAAPGSNIVSTAMGGGRQWRTGTSMASAVVAGALADLISGKRDASWMRARAALINTARRDVAVNTGRLRLNRALNNLLGQPKRKHHKKKRTPSGSKVKQARR